MSEARTSLLTRLSAALIDRYVVDRELGRGGMATVFLARDTRHERLVAVKVLNPELASTLAAQRFLREIRLSARLQHPHIVPMFDSGDADGLLYYVMPYVAGESLRQRLQREGRLSAGEAVRITREVADALGYAHESGVIHRDIKPENILLSGTYAMVADFGVARAIQQAGGDTVTATGHFVGTPLYMSPEQATGGSDIDARSDIYSLGCVLYELLAGSPPLQGPSTQSTLARRLTEPPPSVRVVRTEIGPSVDAALLRALARDPHGRFATTADFAAALADSGLPAVAPPSSTSIVVLPFVNLSADGENEYFSDGLTEEVIGDLSHVAALHVISRTSSMRLKGSERDVPSIGRELNVRYVLEGSVRKSRSDVRIAARLVDAVADAPVWSEKFTGTFEDVFAIQESVSRAIVEALRLRLAPEEERRIRERPIMDVRAWECYLRARHEMNRFTQEGLDRALALLRDGTAVVGDNALLVAMSGYVHLLRLRLHLGSSEVVAALADAEACASRARELDPASAHASFLYAMLAYSRGEMQLAVRELTATMERDPNYVEALYWLAICLFYVGRSAQARACAERLVALDPLTPLNVGLQGGIEMFDGNFEKGIRYSEIFYRKEPDQPVAVWGHGFFLALLGRIADARDVAQRLQTLSPGWVYTQHLLSLLAALEGETELARERISEELIREAQHDPHLSLHLAEVYAVIGMTDAALDAFDIATKRGFIPYPFLARHDHLLNPLRGQPRFQAILERTRQEWERFES